MHEANELFTPLFDRDSGGPACAFRCNVEVHELDPITLKDFPKPCSAITRIKRGMLAHLRIVHGIKLQMELPCLKSRSISTQSNNTNPLKSGGTMSDDTNLQNGINETRNSSSS